jgi:hypothetical protein
VISRDRATRSLIEGVTRIRSDSQCVLPHARLVISLPPVVTHGFHVSDILHINAFIRTNSIKNHYAILFPPFNGLALILLFGVFIAAKRFGQIFSAFAFSPRFLRAFLQNIAVSSTHGLALSTSTFILALIVAFA